jgi:nucleotide-binding universal stress UspA family protein
MKKILVPTDFSEYALNAAKLAARIAKKWDARIYFLHTVDMPVVETGIIPGQTQQDITEGLFVLKLAKKRFSELMSQDFLKGVNVAHAIQFDGVYESVVKQAKKHEIDLIVMGTHGTSGYVNDFFMGSNTDKIIRLSETPVLAIRDEVKIDEFKNIVFASDFSEGVADSFEPIARVIENFDSEVHLVRIITRDDFYYSDPVLNLMDEFAKQKGLKKYTCNVFSADNVQEGINEFAKRQGADLITTITHGRRGLARLFNGSVTNDLVKGSPLPVLTVKAKS